MNVAAPTALPSVPPAAAAAMDPPSPTSPGAGDRFSQVLQQARQPGGAAHAAAGRADGTRGPGPGTDAKAGGPQAESEVGHDGGGAPGTRGAAESAADAAATDATAAQALPPADDRPAGLPAWLWSATAQPGKGGPDADTDATDSPVAHEPLTAERAGAGRRTLPSGTSAAGALSAGAAAADAAQAAATGRADTAAAGADDRFAPLLASAAGIDAAAPGAGAAGTSPAWAAAAPAPAGTAGPAAGTPAGTPAAAEPTTREIREPLHGPSFAPALGAQLTLLVREGVTEARLHLNPAEMGPIAVQIQLDGTQARVEMVAEHAATRQVLEQSMPALAGALRDSGLTLAGGGVFQQSSRQPPPGDGSPGGAQGRASASGNGSGDGDGTATDGTLAAARAPRGVVDVYA